MSAVLRSFGASVRARLSPRLKARLKALFGKEPWPDLAVRHPLFRSPAFRAQRERARVFDVETHNKPILERGHQTSFVLARWFAAAGMARAFHVGYASGRHVFYLTAMGIECGGTDLPDDVTTWVRIPERALDAATRRRLLRVDFFDLTPLHVDSLWTEPGMGPPSVLFSEATFETLLPWRDHGASVPGYLTLGPAALRSMMHERFPTKLAELQSCVRNMMFIEPEPTAGGAGEVFRACAQRLPGFEFGVWRFRPPFDALFRLSPRYPTRQAVYAFTRDPGLLDALGAYAEPL